MWDCMVISLAGIGGLSFLIWGNRLEARRVLAQEALEAQPPTQAEPPLVHEPLYISAAEMRLMGWLPRNDGSGLWELDLNPKHNLN